MSYRYMDAIARLVIISGSVIAAMALSGREPSSVRPSTLAAQHAVAAPRTASAAVAPPADSLRRFETR